MSCNKEGKKKFEKYLDEIGESLPEYCPKCSGKLVRISADGKIWIMPYGLHLDTSLKLKGFDVYCDLCEWSGNIEPDSLEQFNELQRTEEP